VRAIKGAQFKIRIYRPGILIGDSRTGEKERIDGPYYIFEAVKRVLRNYSIFKKCKFLLVPMNLNSVLPLMPVDYAGQIISDSILNIKGEEALLCYNVLCHESPSLHLLTQDMFKVLGMKVNLFGVPESNVGLAFLKILNLPKELKDYLYLKSNYDTCNLIRDFSYVVDFKYTNYRQVFLKNGLDL